MNNKQIVHDILRDYPETRNSDKILLLIYYEKYVKYDIYTHIYTYWFIKDHYNFIASHRRYRRYWQNTKGLFPPTEEVKKGRRRKQAKIVEAIREEKRNFAQNVYAYARRIFDKT